MNTKLNRIYFDNAATTRIDDQVLEAMMPYLKEDYGNSSSIHSFGKSAKVLLEDARDAVASFLGANSKEIFFTSSGTESNNFALKGLAYRFLNTGKNHIITSSIEHSAVLDTTKYLEKKFGFEVTYLKPDSKGKISLTDVTSAIKPETFLISVMHSNNEIGIVNDIQKIAETAAEHKIFVHTDSVQSIGKTEFNVKDLNINLATLSAHKIYGPKGIAALYIKDKTPVEKFIHGGMQERDMRGGTENIAAIAGFKKAVEMLQSGFDNDVRHYDKLKKYTTGKIKGIFGESVFFNSSEENSLPNIVNISFDTEKLSFDEEMILIQLDLKGIAVSGGSACTAGTHKPSHVLTELGRDKKSALGSVRISFGRKNNTEEIDYFAESLKSIVKIKDEN
ncbi:MAG: cysteine desulfurase [Ignavibacteria bacterium]|nr:cysteine desulfurase [Ignavibacteria bacterium]